MNPCKLPIEKMIARCEELRPGTPVEELLMGRLLSAAQHRLAEAKARLLAAEGLTEPLFLALVILLTADDGIQPSELSLMLGASRTSGTRISDELVARGWVERHEVAGDRRCQLLRLTPAGEQFLADMLPRQRARLRAMWAPFAPEERAEFTRLMRRVLEVIPESSEKKSLWLQGLFFAS